VTREGGTEELTLLLIDGDNLLHDVRGGRDERAVAWLLPRLIRWRPPHLHIIVGLDGHAGPGSSRRTKAASGIVFQHSGSRSADDLLIDLLKRQPFADRARTAVVTRDAALQARAHRAGGATRSTAWLERQIASGQRPPVPRPVESAGDVAEERSPWQPGRGATKKKGNPRRSPKRARRR
jgi:hypothetical protein